jgi:hypothetical protein
MKSLSGLQNLAAVGRLDGARVLPVNLGESSHLLRVRFLSRAKDGQTNQTKRRSKKNSLAKLTRIHRAFLSESNDLPLLAAGKLSALTADIQRPVSTS